ncbi:AIPR family protein [Coleofasciculus sp. FACHB-542]|uniref:AIPR family protein n=1 Tax=Coleofasciculus sp. FACHB-542 TaxID=2692787 RepID=UPI001684E83B|nr:AIPR family protein [Coleofasciculus sp. FACHB-542]MBD2083503.1 AIPR family protein [Coleofasciculus sp. FACHB-542]
MSIIHVRQIEAKLKSLFSDLIDLSDYANKSQAEKESAFLTRALAAFAILVTADIAPEQAALCITDGYGDNGIDAIYFDEHEKILFLVQSKWRHNGTGSIERGDALKFIKGVKDLINAEFERFNEKVKKRSIEIQDALLFANTRIALLLTYTGQAPLGEDISRDFNDFLRDMNDPSEVVELRVLRQGQLHSIIASGTLGAPINFDVVLRDWGQTREPFLAYYGQVSAAEVAAWDKYHPRLFAPNIRSFLGTTEINQSIIETLSSEPEKFWYFNNGITALCGTIRKKPIGGSSHDSGVFECTDVSIVNGAQTVGAIATANAKSPDGVAKATVMVRFISLENCSEDFAIRVTRATNTQNRIEKRDFVSLDPEQERLRTELQLEGVDYVYKAGYSLRDIKKGFDLTEATVALACAYSELNYAVQAKSGIGVLWEDVSKAPYKALFNSGVSSVRLWTLVQIHRAIEEQLKIEKNKRQGREAMLPVHGNRFLARQVFRYLSLKSLDDPKTDVQDILDRVKEVSARVVELTISAINEKYPESYLANLFRNIKKCHDIENVVDSLW